MNTRIFTGNYYECEEGNLITISGDRGKEAGFQEKQEKQGRQAKAIPQLAPKKVFWKVYHDNIGRIPEEVNIRYYVEQYYRQVLSKVNIEELLKDEKDPILLCYEKGQDFCHRHVLAEYIEMKYGIKVRDIKVKRINGELKIEENPRPTYIRGMLKDIMPREELSKDR